MNEQNEIHKTLALAGIFQAASLVDILSTQGQVPEDSFIESIHGIFNTTDESLREFSEGTPTATLGLHSLHNSLVYPKDYTTEQLTRYFKAMIRLERIITRHQKMNELIRTRLGHFKRFLCLSGSLTHQSLISKLASLYIDTAGTSKFRVIVRGHPNLLTHQAQREKICAALLAGIRAAHLWRTLGGREWELSFRKRRLLKQLEKLDTMSPFTASSAVE